MESVKIFDNLFMPETMQIFDQSMHDKVWLKIMRKAQQKVL